MTLFQRLFSYELKKIFINRLAVILMMLASVLMLCLTGQRYISGPEERRSWETEQFLEGSPIDDSFFSSLRSWYSSNDEKKPGNPWRFAVVYVGRVFRYGSNQSTESYETWDADLFYERREQVQKEFAEIFHLTEDEMRFWRDKEESVGKPFLYRSTTDVQRLRESYQFILTLTCILISIFLADSFAGESAKRTDELISASKNGQRLTLAAKLAAGAVFSLGTGCWMLIVSHLPTILFSGLHGLNTPWYMVEPFSSITFDAGEMLLLHTLSFLLGCLLTGLFTMLLSLCFNKTAAAMGTVFAAVVIDLFISVPTDRRLLSQIRYLTPLSVLTNSRVQDMRLTKLFGKYLISLQTGPILYVICALILTVILILLFHHRCRKR